jgi:hypothetical protein
MTYIFMAATIQCSVKLKNGAVCHLFATYKRPRFSTNANPPGAVTIRHDCGCSLMLAAGNVRG